MGEQYICNKCNELFDYPEEDHEHADRMRENALEDRMDEDRLEK